MFDALLRLLGLQRIPPVPLYIQDSVVYPPPYTCSGVKMYAFVFKGDHKKIKNYCAQKLNMPCNDVMHYDAITPYVMVTFTNMEKVTAGPPFNNVGWFKETEVTFWVLTMGMKKILGQWIIDPFHPRFFVPYIWVDNPISIAGGREVYGFPKQWGGVVMPESPDKLSSLTLDAFALKTFDPNTEAKTQRLLEIKKTSAASTPLTPPWTGIDAAFEHIMGALFGGPNESLPVELAVDLFHPAVPVVFLKEFRAIENSLDASYQAVTEADATVTRFSGGLLHGDYSLILQDLASEPITADLGMASQPSKLSFWLDIDMVFGFGKTIFSAAKSAEAGSSAGLSPSPQPVPKPTPKPTPDPVVPPKKRQKIAILGGGMAAMTTAFELTSKPGWKDEYEITLYQLGWRLGGKGASGRNMRDHNRIEEHGLHVWGGFYDNAFAVIRQCYAELNRPPTVPIHSWDQAFVGQQYFYLEEVNSKGEWVPWSFDIPKRDSTPGYVDDKPAPMTIWDYIADVLEWIQTRGEGILNEERPSNHSTSEFVNLFSGLADALKGIENELETLVANETRWAMHLVSRLTSKIKTLTEEELKDHPQMLLDLIDHLRASFWKRIEPEIDIIDTLRHLWILIDYVLTIFRGMLSDGLFFKPFDSVNNIRYDDWLTSHKISQITLTSSLLHSMYDIVFAYPNGDMSLANRNIETGTMLRMSLRIMRYRGWIIYRMAAGMGDIVFAPLYDVLKRRGVKFEFFCEVTNLGLSADKKAIDTISIGRQVTIKDGADYDPLITVNDLPCWPSEPLYCQIVQGDTLQAQQINLEAFENGWTNVENFTLRAGQDFDNVVLGISIGAFPMICKELIAASTAWQDMIHNVRTVRTQAFQLWFNESLADLGWTLPKPMTGVIPNTPINTWVAMDQLISQESWADNEVKDIAYFTGVMNFGASYEEALNAVKGNTMNILQNISQLWPKAISPTNPNALDWNKLVAAVGVDGVERFYQQYFRANIDPSELYVQSVSNSSQYRLAANKSGFDRLYLTGDWTENRVNLGMIEGAVTSGMLTSQAMCGYPTYIASVGDFF